MKGYSKTVMITQDEALDKLSDEGYELSKRTLGYWRGEGLLPPLEREGQQYYWKEDVLDSVRTLCSNRIGRESLTTLYIEGNSFEVDYIEIKRIHSKPKIVIYLSNGSFMVKAAREETINAVTKI